jgi:branched-chain amino acid transport system substrate-binding protein
MPQRSRIAAFGIVVLTAVGCGSMASPALKSAAERAQLSTTGVTTAATGDGSTGSGGSTTPGGGRSTGPRGSSTTPGGGRSTGPGGSGRRRKSGTSRSGGKSGSTKGGGASGAPSLAPPAPAGGNGGATDVGVTGNSLTVGSVATISGPEPGLFRGAVAGVQAYFAYINSLGGVYGRQLKVNVGDDGFECSQDQSETQSMVKSDFAIVGGFSLFDNCGAVPLKAAPGVPDVHFALSPQRNALPNNFSIQPATPGAATGPYIWYKSRFGNAYQHAAGLYADVSASVSQWNYAFAAMKSLGYKLVVTDSYSPTDTNFTSDVIQMRSKGVKFVEIYGDPTTIARFAEAAMQQNWHPVITSPGSAYDLTMLKVGGSSVNGVYTSTPTSLFFNASDARTIPAVALYQQWMRRAAPGVTLDLYSVYGWAEAQLFVQALDAEGPKATRAGMLAQLRKIKTFTDGGLVPPGRPATKGPEVCYVLAHVVNGQFVRVDTPSTGFRCGGFHAGG